MSPPKAVIFGSSVRPNRMNDRVILLLEDRLRRKGYDVELLDPKHLQLPILDIPISAYDSEDAMPEKLRKMNDLVKQADVLLFTTCEYNRCVPPALSNMLDYLPHKTMAYKPAGIIAYTIGPDGGQLAGSQLRLSLSELGCILAPHSQLLYNVGDRLSENGTLIGSQADCEATASEMDLIIDQVDYLSTAMRSAASKGIPPKLHPYE